MKRINSSYKLVEFLSGRRSGADTVVNVATITNKDKVCLCGGYEKSCLNALYEREIILFPSKVPEFIRLSIKVTEYARFQNNYFWNYNITVSFSERILSVVVFPAICMRLYRNFRQHKLLFASMSLFQEKV